MSLRRKSFISHRSVVYRRLRFLCVLVVMFSVVAPIPVTQATSAAFGNLIKVVTQSLSRYTTAPQSLATQQPNRTEVPRVRVVIGLTANIPFTAPITSFLMVSPEIASAALTVGSLTITGLHIGETILIAFDGPRRHTFLVEVVGRTRAPTVELEPPAVDGQGGMSGSYSLSYSAPLGAGAGVLQQNLDWRRTLARGGTLRFSSDMFKFMGLGDQDSARASAPGFGLNRISLGIDGPIGALDIMDSRINISPLSFNGYVMRGFHLVSSPTSQLHGMEFFAGLARPSRSLFDVNQGRLMGLVLPIVQGRSGSVRVAMFTVSPQQDNVLSRGGTVVQLDARYEPNKNFTAAGELAMANGGLSWRTQVELHRGPINAHGEILRLDRRSPLISIGAQGGGRETEAFAIQWRASTRLSASFSYNHAALAPPITTRRAALDRTTFFASVNYRLGDNSRLGFRFAQQRIETGTASGGSRFGLETRTTTISHNIRFTKSLANNFQVRLNSSHETGGNAPTESGLSVNDQLRLSFKGGSATAFVSYTRQMPSLAGLIVRNPQLLPPLLQAAFATDPARFLQTNRDTLDVLLPGIELPQTRGLDAGVRLQKAFSRVSLASEAHYSAGEILGRNERNVAASVSMNLSLDAANSLQVSGSRSFDLNHAGGQSALTISYMHRFGAGSGGGFQFSKLLGLDRGRIQGRVYFDLNSNGQDDKDEPGVAGMKVQIDGDRSTTTNEHGAYHFQMNPGEYNVAVISDKLGVQLMAKTTTEQHVSVRSKQTVNLNFGLSNFGLVAGRIFNDVSLTGEKTAGSLPGVGDVRVSLRPTAVGGVTRSMTVDASGGYQFRSVAPGSYMIEIDPASLPADFRVPPQTSWGITVGPLQNFYLDLSLSAQRSVSGVVFVDKDGDGKFDPEKDEPLESAFVISGKTQVSTGKGGVYILRNLPSGRIEVRARVPGGGESRVIVIQLSDEPKRLKGINFAVAR